MRAWLDMAERCVRVDAGGYDDDIVLTAEEAREFGRLLIKLADRLAGDDRGELSDSDFNQREIERFQRRCAEKELARQNRGDAAEGVE